MSGTFLKWLIPGAITVLAGSALALSLTTAPIASDLESRTVAALAAGGAGWAGVSIEGRDAILTGTATTQAMIDTATAQLAATHGVRAVQQDVILAEFVSPFPFAATLAGQRVTLSGGYPSAAAHAAILAAAGDVTDATRLLSGGPAAPQFEAAARFALAALRQLDDGEVALADLSLSLNGRARSLEAYGELQNLRDTAPAGVTVAALTVAPPLATPYVWSASFDGAAVSLSGNIPDPTLETRFRALAPAGVSVSTNLVLGSGEPAGFADNALTLLKTLLLLEQGRATITDGAIELGGAPATPAIVDEVTAAVTALGGVVTLEPPRIADFGLAIDKTADALAFTGFVPDTATRDRLAALPHADTTALQLGRGAPERFVSGLDFGLDLLGLLSEGQLRLDGTEIALTGRTGALADYRALLAKLAEGPPQGFAFGATNILPPLASPYLFKAARDADGTTTLTGFVPGDAARAEFLAHVGGPVVDRTDPADGAPEDFTTLVARGLDVLALLNAGTLAYDGKTWTIDGLVDTVEQGLAADTAFSEAGLRTRGFAYNVRQPSLPIISPYTWRAQKSADGVVAISGFSPNATFRTRAGRVAPAATDTSALGAGAPGDFEPSALAGLEALLALDEGALVLNGNLWTLTGEIADTAARDAVQTALSARIDAANWRIAVQARDSAPLVTPYLWSATRAADGRVELAGHVPSAEQQRAAAERAGIVARDTTAIASGEPAGFASDMRAGLDALAYLEQGRAAFDGSRWLLTGKVASQGQGEAALAALEHGSRNGASWTTILDGYAAPPPAPPAPEAAPSAAEPVPAEPASSEPATPAQPSAEPTPEPPPAAAPPAEDRGLTIVEPLPERFLFEAVKDGGQPIALSGIVPRDEVAEYLGRIAGEVAIDGLVVRTDLPLDFAGNAIAGIRALNDINEGRLGFDGSRWWLRGMAESAAQRDTVTASIAAQQGGKAWSVFIGVLSPLEICRDRVAALEGRNAITFQSGSARLLESSQPVLDELAVDLNLCPEASVHVEGHTDSDGAEDLNLALSVSRAEAVVEALIARNVAIERLYAEGYGEAQPIASNDTSEGKARNRRIAFSISME